MSLPTGILVLSDGTELEGYGIGAVGKSTGEVCFNTSITGYQEILTDPSYAGQIVTFTFPHIGNVGTNEEDMEASAPAARGLIIRTDISNPANYRSAEHLDKWLKDQNIVGLAGIDTRALTRLIREKGMPNGIIAHDPSGEFDKAALLAEAKDFSGLEGLDLAITVATKEAYRWTGSRWDWENGYGEQLDPRYKVVAIDYGVKNNILCCLASAGCDVTVVPPTMSADRILAMEPDGIFLSNGPGDPAATGEYAVPIIHDLIRSGKPIFGICLGHQMLSIALGAKTKKMHQGHHGANHPVKDLTTDKVEITSMNHGFTVDRDTLPDGIFESHISLFDQSNCGIKVSGKPIFSVQYHPEASPGPQDSYYLFERFTKLMGA